MLAPDTRPAPSKSISTNFPKREELSLRTVLALPKASSKGLDSRTWQQHGHLYQPLSPFCLEAGFLPMTNRIDGMEGRKDSI